MDQYRYLPMEDQHHPPTALQKEAIQRVSRELVMQWTKGQFQSFVDSLEQRLFKLADKADNNDAQSRYFEARDEIRQYQMVVENLYHKQLLKAFDNYQQNQLTTSDFSADLMRPQNPAEQDVLRDDMSLVDDSALEEKLAISTMSRKVSADGSETIYALNKRLAALRGGAKMNEQGNPVAPGVFAEALQVSIGDLNLDQRAKLIIYKMFDATFMCNMNQLYQQLNQYLEQQGILPNLTYDINKYPAAEAAQQTQEPLPEELQEQLSSTSISHQIDLFNAIRELQQHLSRNIATAPTTGSTTGGILPTAAIIQTVQQLQQTAGTILAGLGTPEAVTGSNVTQWQQQAEEQARKEAEVDPGVIEIVGLLFEYMLNDKQLPHSVKALLCYLHTPILKIALLDKDFFKHPEHPARQLLNSLVAAGERWVEPEGKHKNDVFLHIKSVVERLLNEFDNDVRLFSELAFEFNQYLRQHSRRIRRAEKLATQAAQGENKLKEIRLKVGSYLKQKVGTIDLSPSVHTLLFEPWANFLAFNLLRFGSRSAQWREAAQAVDDILWYCQPHNIETDHHDRRRIQELQDSLPPTLQKGFDTVGYDAEQSQRLLEALQDRQKVPAAKPHAPRQQPTPADIDQVNITAQAAAARQDPVIMKLKQIDFGTWFEFAADSSSPYRAKLAWSNTNTLHFMFVNRMGQQVTVQTGAQLATGLRTGSVRLISKLEQRPFFEKAMERVLEQLKQRDHNSSQ